MMIAYPEHDFKMKQEGEKELIFDAFRKLWVRLTPEEWVRQNFLQYLVQVKHFPASLIAVETEIKLNDLRKRCDIVVYKDGIPWMIIECKEMNVGLDESVLQQVLRYNMSIPCVYLVITNGNATNAWKLQDGKAEQLAELPEWNERLSPEQN
jgi:predicted type IV restriction endonuclease